NCLERTVRFIVIIGSKIGEYMKHISIIISSIFILFFAGCSIDSISTNTFPTYEHQAVHKDVSKVYYPIEGENISVPSAYVVNFDTGDVLFDKNSNQSLPVASMSKTMSELLVLEAIERGDLQWEEKIPISEYAYTISNTLGIDIIAFEKDETYTVQELFEAMAIRSSNGATIALAEAVAGSESKFVNQMNQKAKELGLTNSSFVNSTGLTNYHIKNFYSVGKLEDSNHMSAYDVVSLAAYLIENYPQLLEITSQLAVDFRGTSFESTNIMLPGAIIDYPDFPVDLDVSFKGVDGFKTGYTDEAGYCFVGTTVIEGVGSLSVVIGTKKLLIRFC